MAGQDIEQVHSFPFGTDENQANSWIASAIYDIKRVLN
ncbi:hypothetical protein LCGC14_2711850, partial [marine sediment metagenome]